VDIALQHLLAQFSQTLQEQTFDQEFWCGKLVATPFSALPKNVGKVRNLVAKLDEATRLRSEADKERYRLTYQTAAAFFHDQPWPHSPLKDLLIEDSRNGIGIRPNDEPPGVPILRISAGTSRFDAVVDEGDYKYLTITKKQLEQYRLRKNDLLACRYNGNLHFAGKFSIYRHESGLDQVYPDKLIRFRVDRSRVLPEFVMLAMNSPRGRKRIESFCATTAGNIGISATDLKTIPVPVPPLGVQESIVNHVQQIQRKLETTKAEADQAKRELDAMLPAILDRAFRGEL
jgi:type I restriction enzyme S subunit